MAFCRAYARRNPACITFLTINNRDLYRNQAPDTLALPCGFSGAGLPLSLNQTITLEYDVELAPGAGEGPAVLLAPA